MKTSTSIVGAVLVIAAAGGVGYWASRLAVQRSAPPAAPAQVTQPAAFTPPPDSAIPDNQFGKEVRQGMAIFEQTGVYAKQYTGNTLSCSNCHLDAGRMANSAPLWAAYVNFPAYRSKNKHVNTYQERIQGCFRYSMNGKVPPLGSPVLVALESYSHWLSKGARVDAAMPGRGYPKLPKPALPPDYSRGEHVFAQHCALCHGADGQGQRAAGTQVFPPLWGPQSYNWGAGMTGIDKAAGFIKTAMPLGLGGTLSDQDAWDVAKFVDSHERPQDPRFTGSVSKTRELYHNSAMSMYGKTVNGVLLGAHSPPSGGTTRAGSR